MDLIRLGQILQQKRETIGLPVTTVAKRAGIGRTTLWKLERGEDTRTGKPSRLSKDKLERLFVVLGIDEVEQEKLLGLADYTINETLLQEPKQPFDERSEASEWEEKKIAGVFSAPIQAPLRVNNSSKQKDNEEEELEQILAELENLRKRVKKLLALKRNKKPQKKEE